MKDNADKIEKAKAYVKRIERLIRPEGPGCGYIQLLRLKEARKLIDDAAKARGAR